jgi:hypothetical protein
VKARGACRRATRTPQPIPRASAYHGAGQLRNPIAKVADVQAYRVEITLAQSNTLTLTNLPFQAGECVEVILLPGPRTTRPREPYPLQRRPITCIDPTEPVGQADWECA